MSTTCLDSRLTSEPGASVLTPREVRSKKREYCTKSISQFTDRFLCRGRVLTLVTVGTLRLVPTLTQFPWHQGVSTCHYQGKSNVDTNCPKKGKKIPIFFFFSDWKRKKEKKKQNPQAKKDSRNWSHQDIKRVKSLWWWSVAMVWEGGRVVVTSYQRVAQVWNWHQLV